VKLIAGLGNPGAKYRETLHNIGFEVVDELARRHGVRFESAPADAMMAKVRYQRPGDTFEPQPQDEAVLLVKPLTFMNVSGRAIGELQRYFKIDVDALLVIVDDVNLPAGQLRARPGGSAGGHNGLKSIIASLGTDQFPRLRVGVGRGDPRRDLADHVLGRVSGELKETLATAVEAAAEAAEVFVTAGIGDVMNRFNRRVETPADGDVKEPAGGGTSGSAGAS
jgi:PTH1 family peptidyl-tRNA hydrolase